MSIALVLKIAGLGQLGIALVSLLLPSYLNWREETSKLSNITREVFWVWGGYIVTTHICFALLSIFKTDLLLFGLGKWVCGFISAWWGIRFMLQFTVMDRSVRPDGVFGIMLEALMVCAFFLLSVTYGLVCLL